MGDNDKPADIKYAELLIENKQLKEKVAADATIVKELQDQLKHANDMISADVKAKKGSELMAVSNYSVEDCAKMGIDELDQRIQTAKMVKTPYKNVRPAGDMGKMKGPNESVPDLFMKRASDIDAGRI